MLGAAAITFTLVFTLNGVVHTTIPNLTEKFCHQLADGLRFKIRSADTGNAMYVNTADWNIECVQDDKPTP